MSGLVRYPLRLCCLLPNRLQRSVQASHQFDGRRWRERQAMGDLDHGLLPVNWPFICFFERQPERSKCKSHGTTVEA